MISTILSTSFIGLVYFCLCSSVRPAERKPNIVLILADDMGYGDLASYGHPTQEFGAVDRLAAEGIRFTQMYTAATFCTPSRAAILTGRLPVRFGFHGDIPVFLPPSSNGLPKDEITLAEALQQAGYATGITGKWHLGINAHRVDDGLHLPKHHGFEYVGRILPFTLVSTCSENQRLTHPERRDLCFLYDGDRLVQQPLTLSNLTDGIVEDAKAFIYNNSHRPFFLYYSLPQTHAPFFGSPRFAGSSRRGPYGDMVNEMSWAVGEVIQTLSELKLQSQTLVIFVSDHGPHREMCDQSGDAGPFRGGKGNLLEGGLRVPMVAWWPGRIAAGQINTEIISTLDLFPTLLQIAGETPPHNTHYDGISLRDLFLREKAQVSWDMSHAMKRNQEEMTINAASKPLHNVFSQPYPRILFFYHSTALMAVRYRNYKVHFRVFRTFGNAEDIAQNCEDGDPVRDYYKGTYAVPDLLDEPLIYDVGRDPGEQLPRSPASHVGLLAEIAELVDAHLESFDSTTTENLLDRSHYSRDLLPCCNPPYCLCQ